MLPSLDAGLRVSIVEGAVRDRAAARTGLVELRRQAHAAFGGFFENGAALVVVRSPEPDEAVRLVAAAGGWEPTRLRGRSWSQTL